MRLPFQALFEQRDFVAMDSALARLWGGANVQTSAGVGVSEDSALNIAAFWRGVQLLSGHLAALPLHLYKSGKQGTQERYTSSNLYKLLHDAPNPEQTAFSLREAMQAHLLTWGNAFAEIERDNIGRPLRLWLITPDRVVFYRDLADKQLKYRIAPSGRVLDAADVLHIPGLGFDGLIGYSVIARARQSLGLMVAAERYGAAFFGNGASFGGVLESPDDMDKPQRDELRKEITNFHQGPDRAHRFLILWNGLKYSKLAMAPEEAQFLQTRNLQVVEIARWLGVPPNKLYETSGRVPPAGSIEAQGIEYVSDTMLMWCEKWEQELNRKLVPPLEQNYQYYEFDTAGLMRADTQARYTAYNIGRQGGWLNVDEIRGFENLGPIPQDAGQVYLAPLNMVPADKFRDYVEKKVVAKTTPPPAPTPTAGSGNAATSGKDQAEQAMRDLTAAIARAEAADLAAAEARGALEAKATELAELKARETVPADLYAATRRDLEAAQAHATELTTLAEKARKTAKRARHAADEARQAQAVQEQRAAAAEAAIADATAKQATAEAERDTARTAAAYATEQAQRAQADLDSRTGELTEARRVLEAHAADVERLSGLHASGATELETLRATLAAATAEASTTAATLGQLRADLAAKEAAQQATAAELAAVQTSATAARRLIEELQQAVTQATADRQSADQARAALEAQWRAAERAVSDTAAVLQGVRTQLADAEAARDAAHATAAQEREQREAAEAARLEAERREVETRTAAEARDREAADLRTQIAERQATVTADHARIGRSLANRRARLEHTMRRMIAVEIERLQRAAGSPDKLRKWVETFYGNHEALCIRELQLTVEDHVINAGRSDDPAMLTKLLVRQHIEQSKREVAAMLDEVRDGDALAGAIFAITQRWERERVEVIANTLLQDELDQIRARLANLPPVEPAIPIRKRVVNKMLIRDEHGRIVGVREEEEPEAAD